MNLQRQARYHWRCASLQNCFQDVPRSRRTLPRCRLTSTFGASRPEFVELFTCQIVHFLIFQPNCLFAALTPNCPFFINLVPNCRIPNSPVPYCPTTLKILALFQDDDAETIKEAFKLFDRDQDGYITCKELIKVH